MKVYVFIGLFGGIVERVETRRDFEKAKEDFLEFTGVPYNSLDDIGEKYNGSGIWENDIYHAISLAADTDMQNENRKLCACMNG